MELISLRTNSLKGANRRNTGMNGAGFDLIHELLWVEVVALAVILSLPVVLEWLDTVASPGAMREVR